MYLDDNLLARLNRLVRALCSKPEHLGSYLRDSLMNPESYAVWSQIYFGRHKDHKRELSPSRRQPWFSYDAIEFLKRNLRRDMDVFEWGAGGSTIFFAQRCHSVRSVESNEDWSTFLLNQFERYSISNASLIQVPEDFVSVSEFETSSYCNAIVESTYDVIIVDGVDVPPFQYRPLCFARAEKHVRPGGWIIVDDAWRYQDLRSNNQAKSLTIFEGIGPGRLGVTSTDIYSY